MAVSKIVESLSQVKDLSFFNLIRYNLNGINVDYLYLALILFHAKRFIHKYSTIVTTNRTIKQHPFTAVTSAISYNLVELKLYRTQFSREALSTSC